MKQNYYEHFFHKMIVLSAFFLLFSLSSNVYAGGVALGATRVIYPLDSKQTSLAITNSDKKNKFLIQSWVDDSQDKKTNDFIVTPPLFVSNPDSENTLRIIYNGRELPRDRESLYWLNTKSIPSANKDDLKDKNVLQIAVLSRIKIFVRPEGLPIQSADAAALLKLSRQGNNLVIDNPSPYYITLINLKWGSQSLDSTMVSPKSKVSIKVPPNTSGIVKYQTINDYGASSPVVTMNIN